MAIANTAKFPNELAKEIDKIYYDSMAGTHSEYEKLAKQENAPPGESIVESEISGLGNMYEIVEGGGVVFDVPEEGHKVARYFTEWGLGFQVTKNALQDSVHGNIKKMPAALGRSAVQKINVQFFDLFNSGFDTHQSWDGKFIFDTTHDLLKSSDVISNEVAADLSEASLQAAFEYFDKLKTEEGFPEFMTPSTLLVPVDLRWTAMKLNSGDRVLGNNNNDYLTTNPQYGMVPGWQVMVSRYLTDSNAWFLLSDEHDFKLVWKQKPVLENADDFHTGSRLYKNTTRFSVYCNKYKGGYGSSGTT